MCNNFSNYLDFGGLFPCFCEFSKSSLVSKLQDREPGKKPYLTVESLDFEMETELFLIRVAKQRF